MTTLEFDLAQLLQPVGMESFFSRHWEREPLLIPRNDPHFYDSLVTREAIESFISRGDARYPALRVVKAGKFQAADAYTHDLRYGDEIFRGVPDLERILTEYHQGATLSLPAWHRVWPALGRLCARLESLLDHVVNANVYLTPAGTAGFTPHYDNHDVLVLQIAGRKRWRIDAPSAPLPHRTQIFDFDNHVPSAAALLECELSPGDLLYLPRGYVHTTTTGPESSTHVTLGVTVYTWVELLTEMCQAATELPEFRTALTPGFAHRADVKAKLAEQFPRMLRQLSESLDVDAMIERLGRRAAGARPRAPIEFHTDSTAIGPRTLLRIRPGITYTLDQERDSLILTLNGRRIRLQSAVAPLLNAIVQAGDFTPESLPADISLDARLTLTRYLVGIGFLGEPGRDHH